MSRWHATFLSFQNRNFRLFFAGQALSTTGTWMHKIGQAWLVLELTGSGTMLGVVAALQQLPVLLLGPWGGVLADRMDNRRILLITQVSSAVLAFSLGLLTALDVVTLWMVLVFAVAHGSMDAVDRPARQTIVVDMVGTSQLINAVTLNSVIINVAKAVGPAIGGIIIAGLGLSWSFFANAASYLAVVLALALMRPVDMHSTATVVPVAPGQLREGARYIRGKPALAGPLFLMLVAGLLAYEWQVTLPLLARDAFDGGADVFGLMFSAMGVGAVIGGLLVAGTTTVSPSRLIWVSWIFSALMLAVAFAKSLPLVLVLLLVVGGANVSMKSYATVLLQLGSRPQMRGRVMAFLGVCIAGSTPIGGPLVGWIGEQSNAGTAIAVGAIGTAIATAMTSRYMRRSGVWEPRLTRPSAERAGTPEIST